MSNELRGGGACYQLAEAYRVELQKNDLPRFAQLTDSAALLPDVRPEALLKLLRSESKKSFQIRSAKVEARPLLDPVFESLRAAIAGQQKCQLTYKDKARTLCPYRLIAQQGVWYLAATEDGQLKSFALARIKQLQRSESNFQPLPAIHAQLDAADDIWLNNENIEVTLSIAAPVARYFQRRALLPQQEILASYPDGSLRLKSVARHLHQILPVIRYWLPHVAIIEPLFLAKMLEQELQAYLEQIKNAAQH